MAVWLIAKRSKTLAKRIVGERTVNRRVSCLISTHESRSSNGVASQNAGRIGTFDIEQNLKIDRDSWRNEGAYLKRSKRGMWNELTFDECPTTSLVLELVFPHLVHSLPPFFTVISNQAFLNACCRQVPEECRPRPPAVQYDGINALRRVRCRVWPDAKAGAWRRIGPECLDGC